MQASKHQLSLAYNTCVIHYYYDLIALNRFGTASLLLLNVSFSISESDECMSFVDLNRTLRINITAAKKFEIGGCV